MGRKPSLRSKTARKTRRKKKRAAKFARRACDEVEIIATERALNAPINRPPSPDRSKLNRSQRRDYVKDKPRRGIDIIPHPNTKPNITPTTYKKQTSYEKEVGKIKELLSQNKQIGSKKRKRELHFAERNIAAQVDQESFKAYDLWGKDFRNDSRKVYHRSKKMKDVDERWVVDNQADQNSMKTYNKRKYKPPVTDVSNVGTKAKPLPGQSYNPDAVDHKKAMEHVAKQVTDLEARNEKLYEHFTYTDKAGNKKLYGQRRFKNHEFKPGHEIKGLEKYDAEIPKDHFEPKPQDRSYRDRKKNFKFVLKQNPNGKFYRVNVSITERHRNNLRKKYLREKKEQWDKVDKIVDKFMDPEEVKKRNTPKPKKVVPSHKGGRFEVEDFDEVLLPEELPGKLINLKPKGNLLREQILNINQRRWILAKNSRKRYENKLKKNSTKNYIIPTNYLYPPEEISEKMRLLREEKQNMKKKKNAKFTM